MSRFAYISEEDLTRLENAKDSMNTKRVVNRSVKLFREFLGEENQFEDFPKSVLNNQLQLFFASLRTCKGGELKKSSLHSIKYGLVKYIKENCGVDIGQDAEFESTRKIFKAKLTDLQKKGKGSVEHKKEITSDDLQTLNDKNNLAFNTSTPVGLQNKVWFDIMYHLCRRGQENLRLMKKSTFAVNTDSSGREYVSQILDEADKNHGGDAGPDDTIGEARMYAQQGAMCPVKSFKEYIKKLHPECDDLWQRPRESYKLTDSVWYCCSPLGKNSLSQMMPRISTLAGLSCRYTNHCIRATSISTLDRAGFEARHIIRASGHRSEKSVKSYACRLTETRKRQMSDALNNNLSGRMNETSAQTLGDLTTEDLDRIFSCDNEFADISEISNDKCVEVQAPYVMSSCDKVSTTNTSSVSQVNTLSPQIFNFPSNLAANADCYNITPQMHNCTAHFYFNAK